MSLNIYFAGSITAGRQDAEIYARIVQQLRAYGTVLTKHVAEKDPEACEVGMTHKEIHDRDMNWMYKSDVVIAECTQPSLGVGYEIGRAIALNKKILILFRPDNGKRLSAMIRGTENGNGCLVKDYKDEDLPGIFKDFFSSHRQF